jgi:acyl-coenzyme A synthetase/AMP-(fatty) acid ligase
MNAAEVLLADAAPADTALVCGDASIAYGALREATARAAAAWRRLGVQPGERVAIKLPDGIDWTIAYLGAIWAGAIAVAVNPRVPAEEWQRIVGEAEFRFVLDDAAATAWADALRAAAPIAACQVDAEAPAFWSHSSGTSGAPKAVIHPHRFALAVERVAREVLGVTRADRLYASSKLFFVYPLANSLFAGLKLGATVVLDPAWPSAAQAAATIARARPTVFFSVPSLLRALLAEGHAPRLAASGLRLAVSAGEALPAALREQWRAATGIALVDGYGASETLCLALVDTGAGLRPAPGAQVTPASEHTPGRILIRLPTLALGYFDRPAAQAECFRDGGFLPADLFEREAGGGWRFAGREDSLVKVRGRWVDLVELEQRLAAACPGIVEAAAVAVTDAEGVTEIALAYVAAGDVRAALAAAIEALPPHRRPRWLHEVGALPRTATGKLLRRKLRALHEARVVAQPEAR